MCRLQCTNLLYIQAFLKLYFITLLKGVLGILFYHITQGYSWNANSSQCSKVVFQCYFITLVKELLATRGLAKLGDFVL
jgi:hypothetical protein